MRPISAISATISFWISIEQKVFKHNWTPIRCDSMRFPWNFPAIINTNRPDGLLMAFKLDSIVFTDWFRSTSFFALHANWSIVIDCTQPGWQDHRYDVMSLCIWFNYHEIIVSSAWLNLISFVPYLWISVTPHTPCEDAWWCHCTTHATDIQFKCRCIIAMPTNGNSMRTNPNNTNQSIGEQRRWRQQSSAHIFDHNTFYA